MKHVSYLDNKPLCRLGLKQQDIEQVEDLPQHLEGPSDDEGEGLREVGTERNQWTDLNIAVLVQGREQGRLWEVVRTELLRLEDESGINLPL